MKQGYKNLHSLITDQICQRFSTDNNKIYHLQSKILFVREFTEEQEAEYQQRLDRRTRYDINGKVITDPLVLEQIKLMVSKCLKLLYLCQPVTAVSYFDFCKKSNVRVLPNDCYFLGLLPPFVTANNNILCFDYPAD